MCTQAAVLSSADASDRAHATRLDAAERRHAQVMAAMRGATAEEFDRIAREYRYELQGGPPARLTD